MPLASQSAMTINSHFALKNNVLKPLSPPKSEPFTLKTGFSLKQFTLNQQLRMYIVDSVEYSTHEYFAKLTNQGVFWAHANTMLKTIKLFLAVTLCTYLLGCGTDTSSGDQAADVGGIPTPGVKVTTSGGTGSASSSFSLRLTDAPIDGLENVVVQFAAVEMKLKSGAWTRYTLPAPQPIDLLALQGLTTADLLVNMPIEAGEYKQVRFIVDDAPMANRVKVKGGAWKELEVPGGATTGLKIKQKFTIPENRPVNFTVDFNLRKSVKLKGKSGKYKLNAKMKLVVDSDVGFIRGSVDPALLMASSCSDNDVDTHNAVYVYPGPNLIPGDIDEASPANNEPETTTLVKYDNTTGLYLFEAAFLAAGDYTIAFTCNADREVLDVDDDGDDGDDNDDDALNFFGVQNVTILITDTTFLKP